MAEPSGSGQFASLVARLADLEQMVRTQQAEIESLRAGALAPRSMPARHHELGASPKAGALAPALLPAEPAGHMARASRRALLKLGGAAAAAGMAAVAASASEFAHPGTARARSETATFLQTASGSTNTAIEGDGTSGAIGLTGGSDSGVGVYGASTSFYGVWGSSSSNIGVLGTSTTSTGVHGKTDSGTGVHGIATQGIGILGESTQGNGVGVYASSDGGSGVIATSSSGVGVSGASSTGVGGIFSGGRAALSLTPRTFFPGPPTSGQHYGGDLYVDVLFVLWYCIASGAPGTWVRLTRVANGVLGGALNYLSAPIRIFDSRVGQPAPLPATKAALAGGSTTTIQVTGTTVGGLSVPAGAVGVIGNLTVTDTQGGGDLILYPHGAAQPLTSNINYAGGQTVANAFNVGLSTGGAMDLYVHVSGTDVIIDVSGYVL